MRFKPVVENPPDTDVYELLRQSLDNWVVGLPKSPTAIALLKEIFTEQEAKILSAFNGPILDPQKPKKIARKLGLSEEEVAGILDGLLHRALVTINKRGEYLMIPFVVGVFEMFFSNVKQCDPERFKRASELVVKYKHEGFIQEFGHSDYPLFRVVPSNAATTAEAPADALAAATTDPPESTESRDRVIEVGESVDVSHQIMAGSEVEALITSAKKVGVMPCSCRTAASLTGHACQGNHPVEVCLAFEPALIEIGLAREISKPEAIELLRKCERHGLVHTTYNYAGGRPQFICNCCPDCCGILLGFTRYNNPRAFSISNFIAAIDETQGCTHCLLCIQRCPTGAIRPELPDSEGVERWVITPNRCIGCGVCSAVCPTHRMVLKKVREVDRVPDIRTAFLRHHQEKAAQQ